MALLSKIPATSISPVMTVQKGLQQVMGVHFSASGWSEGASCHCEEVVEKGFWGRCELS
jgi:hypothetical protein